MKIPVSQRHDPEFNPRNLWLQLSLGMLSIGRRLDALLERHAVPVVGDLPADPRDAHLVHAVLGLVALRARWLKITTDAVAAAPTPIAPLRIPEMDAPSVRLRDLLR